MQIADGTGYRTAPWLPSLFDAFPVKKDPEGVIV
jgi:hypothetical protein